MSFESLVSLGLVLVNLVKRLMSNCLFFFFVLCLFSINWQKTIYSVFLPVIDYADIIYRALQAHLCINWMCFIILSYIVFTNAPFSAHHWQLYSMVNSSSLEGLKLFCSSISKGICWKSPPCFLSLANYFPNKCSFKSYSCFSPWKCSK